RRGLEQVDAPGEIETARPVASEARIVHDGANAREPWLMVEPNAYQQGRRPQPGELAWGDLDRVRIVKRRGQALDRDALAAHRGDQRLEIRRGRHHGDDVRSRRGARWRGGGQDEAEGSEQLRLLGEDRLRDHAVHALADVHYLRDAAVGRHRRQGIRLVATHRDDLLLLQEIHGLADGVDHRLVEVLVESHGDPVGLRLHPRPLELHVLADDELHRDLAIGALERREVDLAVALPAVRVTGPHEPALQEDGNEDRGAFLQLVEVHVRAVLPRPQRRDGRHRVGRSALAGRRIVGVDAHRQRAGERPEIERDAWLELGLTLLEIEREELDEPVGHLGGQAADRWEVLARQVEVDAERVGNDLDDGNLHHVTGLGAVDVDRARHRVRPAAWVRAAQRDELVHRDAGPDLVVRVHHRLDRHDVPRIDGELRRLL